MSLNRRYWNIGNASENAETLLHELGHIYNFTRGSGGFSLPNRATSQLYALAVEVCQRFVRSSLMLGESCAQKHFADRLFTLRLCIFSCKCASQGTQQARSEEEKGMAREPDREL